MESTRSVAVPDNDGKKRKMEHGANPLQNVPTRVASLDDGLLVTKIARGGNHTFIAACHYLVQIKGSCSHHGTFLLFSYTVEHFGMHLDKQSLLMKLIYLSIGAAIGSKGQL